MYSMISDHFFDHWLYYSFRFR